jgi:hypothetical protein
MEFRERVWRHECFWHRAESSGKLADTVMDLKAVWKQVVCWPCESAAWTRHHWSCNVSVSKCKGLINHGINMAIIIGMEPSSAWRLGAQSPVLNSSPSWPASLDNTNSFTNRPYCSSRMWMLGYHHVIQSRVGSGEIHDAWSGHGAGFSSSFSVFSCW